MEQLGGGEHLDPGHGQVGGVNDGYHVVIKDASLAMSVVGVMHHAGHILVHFKVTYLLLCC